MDPIKNTPKYLSTYKIYEHVIGPIYLRKKVFRERTHTMDSIEAVERALNNNNL